jgi:hypothetical protein
MTNAEITENAETAPLANVAAGAEQVALDEYSFNGADGSPEGSIFASSLDEACMLFGLECLSEYAGGVFSVWGPDCSGREYMIERSGEDVTAKPWEADVQ